MIAARCGSCGANGPIGLADEHRFRCDHCGAVSATTPHLKQQILDARSVLGSAQVERRQLSQGRRKSVASVGWAGLRYTLYSALFGLPLFSCVIFGVFNQEGGDLFALILCGGPFLAFVLVWIFGLFQVRRRVNRLRRRALAFPPVSPGAPCRCHVCGGPLNLDAQKGAVVRCDYCAADNLVDPALLTQVQGERTWELDGFRTSVGREASAVHDASERWGLSMALMALLAPFFGCILSAGMFFVVMQFEGDPSDQALFAVVATPEGDCVAEYIYGGTVVHFGHNAPNSVLPSLPVEEATIRRTLRATELSGQQIFWNTASGYKEGVVTDVYGKTFTGDMLRLTDSTGRTSVRGIRGVCFLDTRP